MARLQARAGSPGCNRLWCRNDLIVIAALLLGDSLLTFLIVCKVPYTKIDWDAYMAQVSGFLGGERNYLNLKGDTGPLVYPAGFLYIYSAIKYLTGGEVFPAQIIFGILYIVNLSIIMAVYYRTKVLPWWALCFLCLSRRMHSIFMLRLFNDCIATTLAHLAIFLFQNHRWKFGMVIFSVAVSVKMNVLLYAPSLLLLLLEELTVFDTIATLFIAAFVQLVLGMPFLLSYPLQYMMKAFDLGRVFLYTWSVNFKFIPEEIFISKRFALALLIIHLGLLFLFAEFKWTKQQGGLIKAMKSRLKKLCKDSQKQTGRLDPKYITTVMFSGNFIGILCARSLHYQFYSWYFYSLPYLLWRSCLPTYSRIIILGLIEICWNIFPSNSMSSFVLLICHLILLLGLWWGPTESPFIDSSTSSKKLE